MKRDRARANGAQVRGWKWRYALNLASVILSLRTFIEHVLNTRTIKAGQSTIVAGRA